MGTLTVASPRASGYLTAYPCHVPRPVASNGNYRPGQTVATFVSVPTDPSGAFCVYTSAASHVVFDQVVSTVAVSAKTPARILDTRRPKDGAARQKAGTVRRVATGVPRAVVGGTLTATDAASTGYLTAFPCDGVQPVTSQLTYPARFSVANQIMVSTNAAGEFCVYTNAHVHVIFDQVTTSPGASAFNASNPPVRTVDTRLGGAQAPPDGHVVRVRAKTSGGTVFGNLTVTEGRGSGYLTAFACDQPRPTTSNLNYLSRQAVSNFVAVRTDPAGEFCVYLSRSAHVVFDESATSIAILAAQPHRLADSRRDWLGAGQIMTVSVDRSSNTWHTYSLWERQSDGRFTRVFGPAYGWVGEAGIGQANSWTPRTPAGVYTLTQSFGIKDNPGTRLPFFKVDQYDWWNGDSTSPGYNTRYRGVTGPPNSEHLIDYGKAYWYSVVIDYNTERIPYAGAAFFLHVATGGPTGGCVSVSEQDMVRIMRWLDPAKNPVISIGVGAEASVIVDRANS